MRSGITVERAGRVTTIRLNRPEAMNAITPEMHEDLQSALDDFANDDSQFIGVITGAGERAFCAGSDLKSVDRLKGYPKHGYAGLIERFDLDKPLIAAVNGLALGGGFEIVLACDIVVAAPHATFGLPEPLVGGVALGGGVHRLVRQVGLKPAMGMMLGSERIDVQRALALGLVNEVASQDGLAEAVEGWCQKLLRGAPLSLRATKEMALHGLTEPSLADAIANQKSYPAFVRWRNSEDVQEGVSAFVEKRSPDWKGR